jgi:hypothetical protein
MFAGKNINNMKSRFAMDLKARCVAELHQTFKAHKGQLIVEPNSTPIHFSTDISSSGVIFKDVLPGINSLCQ